MNDHLNYFQEFLNSCHINQFFSLETEKENELSYLIVEVICKQDKFAATINRHLFFSGLYCNFESFLPSVYKFGMVYALIYRCFCICSDRVKFATEWIFLKWIFQKIGKPENFFYKCCNKLLDNIHLDKENVPTVERLRDNIFTIYILTTQSVKQCFQLLQTKNDF